MPANQVWLRLDAVAKTFLTTSQHECADHDQPQSRSPPRMTDQMMECDETVFVRQSLRNVLGPILISDVPIPTYDIRAIEQVGAGSRIVIVEPQRIFQRISFHN